MNDLTDEQRELQIKEAGEAMQRAYAAWESTGCFDARGKADAERVRMEGLIRCRSAAMVARLEQERGLSRA